MSLTIVSDSPAERGMWEEAARGCEYATYFHTPEWSEVFASYLGGGSAPASRCVEFSDGTRAIVVLLKHRRAGGLLTTYLSSAAGGFGGWISSDSLSLDHRRLLVDYMQSFDNLIWRENPYDRVLAQLPLAGSTDDFTQSADLSEGLETVEARYSHNHVNAVKKARKLGVQVRQAQSTDDWRKHYEAYRALRSRWRRARNNYRWSLFEMLSSVQSPNITLWLAEYEGALVSSVVCFYWNKHAVAWHNASSQEHFQVRANDLIHYEILHDAAQRGCRWMDRNPSGGNRGVVDFKRHQGMEKLRSRIVVQRSGLLKLAHVVRHPVDI